MNVVADTEGAAKAALMAQSDFVEAFIVDVNGVLRGKWLQPGKSKTLFGPGLAIPRSVFLLDIWGNDVVEDGIAQESGDPDGLCTAVPHTITRMPWAEGNTAQALLTMRESKKEPTARQARPRR
ncbi:MAG: hypothetical protein ACLPJJ_07710 [Acidocella sp.]|uniref:hypothetical protein n=1 Tax=Acidocella sp. TaxID=50710 RepID=UPI003FD83EE9